jgi:succinoglycan biosynthesis protein ExoM
VSAAARRVAVGVCTAYRAEMLAACLEAIAAQAVPEGTEVILIVADNEPEPGNRPLVERFAGSCPFPVRYVHEPRPGIPQARNAVLAEAERLESDWIAFTDDDCRPAPNWIASLLAAAERHRADVTYGRRDFMLPDTFWATAPDQGKHVEGEELEYAATHNVLMAGRLARQRFDERLAHGEDTDFFYRAKLAGSRIVFSAEPVVFETVPPERATLWYQARRSYYYAASRTNFHRRYRGIGMAAGKVAVRFAWQAPVALVRFATAPLLWPFGRQRFKRTVLKGASRLMGAAGAMAGLFGFAGNPYRR